MPGPGGWGTANAFRRTGLLVALLSTACIDKELTVPTGAGPRVSLQIAVGGIAPAVGGADDLIVGVVYFNATDTIPLAVVRAPAQAEHQLPLELNLTACLGDQTRLGSRDACSVWVVAALVAGSFSLDEDDVLVDSYDAVLLGPYDVAPGRIPNIPPIDLQASRVAAATWEPDDALRLGGPQIPDFFYGPTAGVVPASGGAPVIYGLTLGPAQFVVGQSLQSYAQLSIFENGAWRRVIATAAPPAQPFRGMSALSTSEAYLAHGNGLYKFDGTSITKVSGITDDLFSVASITVGNQKLVIAGGSSGVVWMGDTQTWTRYVLPSPNRATSVCITGPNEAFAAVSTSAGSLFRFDGTTWSAVTSGFAPKTDLTCPGPGQAFVVAGGTAILSWTGSGWQNLTTAGLGGRSVSIAAVSPSEIYAVGETGNTDRAWFRYNGATWTDIGRTRFTRRSGTVDRGPWADPRGGAVYFLSAFGRLERAGTGGPAVLSYQPSMRDLWVHSGTSAYAVGMNAFLARWDGLRWHVDAPPPGMNVTRTIHGVWADGPSNAWAVGDSSLILRWNGTAWQTVSDAAAPVATPDDYFAVWGTAGDVWIAGAATMVRCRTGVPCATVSTGAATPLYSVWGASPDDVWAVGAGGRIVRWNGTAWAAAPSPTLANLARVRGSGPTDLWAVGSQVLLRYDGAQWTSVPMTGFLSSVLSPVPSSTQPTLFQLGLHVRGPRDAYVGGDFANRARWTGTEWRYVPPVDFSRRIVAISGTADGCMLIATEGVVNTPPPSLWRGIGVAGCFSAAMGTPASWP